jgi:23S rRNA-/tRNA-specific pseudouridylate synthase
MSPPNLTVPRLIGAKEGILAVYKPAGMLAHPSAEAQAPDLISWLRSQGGALRKALPAHRLDLETSGIVLCAQDPDARAALGRAFEDGLIQKTYLAVVIGQAHEKGVIRRPLQDARRGHALDAVTRYRLVEALGASACSRSSRRPAENTRSDATYRVSACPSSVTPATRRHAR